MGVHSFWKDFHRLFKGLLLGGQAPSSPAGVGPRGPRSLRVTRLRRPAGAARGWDVTDGHAGGSGRAGDKQCIPCAFEI